jgi:type I protein arginine methyltransferase
VKQIIIRFTRSAFAYAKRVIRTNRTFRNLLYDLHNVDSFSDLKMHEMMLADSVRIDAYRQGIKNNIKPGDIVIDLGTGTGILSLFASQQSPLRIYAIDHSDIINVAKQIAANNNVTNVTFIKTNSRDFVPEDKADVILHEQFNHTLFGENMIENLVDLRRRVLKPSGFLLPGKFELYLEPVCLKPAYRVPYIWEQQVQEFTFNFLRHAPEVERYKAIGYHSSMSSRESVDFFMCRPVPLLTIDLNDWTQTFKLPTVIKMTRTMDRAGQMDGMCLYFRVIFDAETSFDTSPLSRKTHWPNHIFRVESRLFSENAAFTYRLEIDEITDVRRWFLSID